MVGLRYFQLALKAIVVVIVFSLLLGGLLGQPIGVGYVETGSMVPTLEPQDGFIAIPTALTGDIETGDVVTFRARVLQGGGLTTHRIAGETDSGYLTHGDANPFLDQETGEPPVMRSQIVAVAFQVDNKVVVIPSFGILVTGTREIVSSIGSVVGLDGGPTEVGTVFVAMVAASYVLDELLGVPESRRETERQQSRETGFDPRTLLAIGLSVVLVIATLSMVLPTGTSSIPFDSVGPEESRGGIVAGSSETITAELSNRGLTPLVAVLETPNGAPLSRETVVLGPRDTTTVDVTITAPNEPGAYEQRVIQYRYLGILPASTIFALHEIHPWVAIALIDVLLGVTLLGAGRVLLGQSRIRLRSGRDVPVETSVRRAFRRLYR